jgi:hypothetical protein
MAKLPKTRKGEATDAPAPPVELADVIGVLEAHIEATALIVETLRELRLAGHKTLPAQDAARLIAELGVPGGMEAWRDRMGEPD